MSNDERLKGGKAVISARKHSQIFTFFKIERDSKGGLGVISLRTPVNVFFLAVCSNFDTRE